VRTLLVLILARLREGHGAIVLKCNSLLYTVLRDSRAGVTQLGLIAAESVNVLDGASLQLLNSNLIKKDSVEH